MSQMVEKPKIMNVIHYLYGILSGTTTNEAKMQGCLKLRNLKLGLYCILNNLSFCCNPFLHGGMEVFLLITFGHSFGGLGRKFYNLNASIFDRFLEHGLCSVPLALYSVTDVFISVVMKAAFSCSGNTTATVCVSVQCGC